MADDVDGNRKAISKMNIKLKLMRELDWWLKNNNWQYHTISPASQKLYFNENINYLTFHLRLSFLLKYSSITSDEGLLAINLA